MTGSTRVVTLLNRLGHGLSASQVGEIEAGMSQQILSRQTDSACAFVPSNITPSSFVHLVWDNNDIKLNMTVLAGEHTYNTRFS